MQFIFWKKLDKKLIYEVWGLVAIIKEIKKTRMEQMYSIEYFVTEAINIAYWNIDFLKRRIEYKEKDTKWTPKPDTIKAN